MSDIVDEVVVVRTHDQILDYTQTKRQEMVDAVIKANNNQMPTDPDTQKLLLQTLDGMDRNALGRKKIAIDAQANKNTANHQTLVAELLRQNRNAGGHMVAAVVSARSAPRLSDDIPPPVVVPGELSQSPTKMSIEQFNSQFEDTPEQDS